MTNAEYQPGRAGNGVSGTAGAGRESSAQKVNTELNTAYAEAIIGRSARSKYTRRLSALYSRIDRGEASPEQVAKEVDSIVKKVVRANQYRMPETDEASNRRNYLKNTRIYLSPEDARIIFQEELGNESGEDIASLYKQKINWKYGLNLTADPTEGIPMDVALREVSDMNAWTRTGENLTEEFSGLIQENQVLPPVDKDMLAAQRAFLKAKILSRDSYRMTFDEWLARLGENKNTLPKYMRRIYDRYFIAPEFSATGARYQNEYAQLNRDLEQGRRESDQRAAVKQAAGKNMQAAAQQNAAESSVFSQLFQDQNQFNETLRRRDASNAVMQEAAKRAKVDRMLPNADVDPNLQSLFDSDPMAAPKDSSPIDMQALYDTDLSGTTNTSAQPVDAPDEYGIASLFRSDPQGPGLSDQAQIDAQTSLRQLETTGGNQSLSSPANMARFAREIDGAIDGSRSTRENIVIGQTPELYHQLGAKPLTLTMKPSAVHKIAYPPDYFGGKHNLGIPALKHLPEQLENPLAVLKSASQKDSLVVLTEWNDLYGNPVIVPIHLNKQGTVELENSIASAYGKENISSIIGTNNENVLWTKGNEDISTFLSARLQLPTAVTEDTLVSKSSIAQSEENATKNETAPPPTVRLQLPQETGGNDLVSKNSITQGENTVNTLTEEQKQLAGLTGDLVKDTFARHPITQRVNYGQEAAEIRQAEADKKALQKEWDQYRRASSSTRVEEADAKQIAAGEKTMDQLSRGSRPEVVQDLADIQQRIAQSKQTGLQAQKRSIFEHQQTIFRGILSQITDPAQLVKKKLHVSRLNRRTPERALRLVFGPKLGQQLSDILIKPIHANESAKIQVQNELFDNIRKLGLTEIDSKLTQLVGERVPGKNGRPMTLEDIKAGNITEESLPGFIDKKDRDYILGHLKEANPERIAIGVDFFQKFYKSLHEVINDVRLEHGQAEIGWQENYFPHWSKDDPLTKTLKTFGLDSVGSLPTSIAGKTAWFRPNSRFVQFFEKRRGPATMYDAVYGAQLYTAAVLDMAYHIDDVMRLRNFDAAMRGKAGEIDVANAIDSIFGKKNLVIPEEDIAVMEKTLEGEYMDMEAPEDYAQVAQWVTNFTNKLANKQLFQDRGFEEVFGRAALNTANFIESQFAKNSVVGNLSSALNNSVVLPKILATTDQKYVAQALKSRIMNPSEMKELAAKSEFLMGKKGVRNLVESPFQKAMRMVSEHTFEPVEELMSGLAFYSKYLEQVDKNGMNQSAAIEAANDYAANMMARRSKGGRPLNMESKNPFIKLFTTFQTEVSNDWYSVIQDLPEYTIQNMGGGNNAELAKKIGIGALKYCIYARALNMALEFVTGFAPAPDPLMWIWEFGTTLLGGDDDDEEKNLLGRAGDAAAGLTVDILNQVPGASTVMALAGLGEGRIPLPEIGKDNLSNVWEALKSNEEIPNREDYILDQLWRGAAKPVLSLAMPFGGNQLRKTAEGLRTFADGGMYTQSKQGKQLQVEVNNDLSTLGGWRNLISAAAFGKSAIPEVREYYDNGGKTKSIKYTEAHDAGYETSVLDQLFPTSTQSTGKVSYEKLTGGAEGAAEVDNWLNQLAENTGKDSMLPSNTTPNITADGEKVELSGTDMMEYAQTKQETSYSILSALYPVADTIPEAAQVSYASAAQDYATAVAKEAVAGVAPAENSWIAKVQDQAGVSGTEVTDELLNVMLARAIINSTEGSKNTVGQTISGSKKRNAIQALQNAGFSGQEAVRLYNLLG